MAAIGDLIAFVVVALVIVAGLSLLTIGAPATPPFARRAATSATVQLRQDPNAGFIIDRGFLFRRRFWFVGTCCAPVRIDAEQYRQLDAAQHRQPVPVARSGGRVWWWFEDGFYWESGRYGERGVLALIKDRQRRSAQRLERAHMLLNVEEGQAPRVRGKRETIPERWLRLKYFRCSGLAGRWSWVCLAART